MREVQETERQRDARDGAPRLFCISCARRSEARAGESGRVDMLSARDDSDIRRSGVRARPGDRALGSPRLRSVDSARERSSSELRPPARGVALVLAGLE